MRGLNVERLHKLADVIEVQKDNSKLSQQQTWKADEGFDMRHVTHECGTPSCIAGFVFNLFGGGQMLMSGGLSTAAELLGGEYYVKTKDAVELHPLFMPAPRSPAWHATPAQAAQVIRHLAATGEINWDKFVPAKEEEK